MLSKVLEEISEVSGFAGALELCRGYGGRTVYVPPKMVETHPLALTMGYRAACALAGRFGGEQLSVPSERSGLMQVRNRRMAQAYIGDPSASPPVLPATVSALASEYGLTRKRVVDILDEMLIPRRSLEE